MMNQTYEQIVDVIVEKGNVSKEDVEKKIEDKLNQLSGLISKEGAAHIIANEMNINVTQTVADQKLKIDKIKAGMRNVEVACKVLQKYEIRDFAVNGRQGRVGNMLIGDDTGVMRIVLWNDLTDTMKDLKEGDVLKVISAYAKNNNGRTELHLNNMSKIEVNPSDEKMDNVKTSLFERKKISELAQGDQNAEILGTIVQVFDPRFFEVCPDCNKRARPAEEGFACPIHGVVSPDYSYVFNIFLDDGSDNVRIVCFKNQMQALLNKNHDDILVYKENPAGFENIKHDLLGRMAKIQGRVVRNEMFDRLELISSRVFIDPDAKKEINNLKKQEDTNNNPDTSATSQSVSSNSESFENNDSNKEQEQSLNDKNPEENDYSVVSENISDEQNNSDDLGNLEEESVSEQTNSEEEKKKQYDDELDELESLDELEETDDI